MYDAGSVGNGSWTEAGTSRWPDPTEGYQSGLCKFVSEICMAWWHAREEVETSPIKSNQIKSNYFIVRLKVDQRAGQLSLPHLNFLQLLQILDRR